MGEFFKGWRQKVGLLTLLMALVFMGGWMRSYAFTDFFDTSILKADYGLMSDGGSLQWFALERKVEMGLGSDWPLRWHSNPFLSSGSRDPLDSMIEWNWRWQSCGFHFAEGKNYLHEKPLSLWTAIGIVPYWSIVCSLTLISAFLLLSKPRKSTTKKPANPIEEKGAAAS